MTIERKRVGPPIGQPASIGSVAAMAGVSIATVSRVLNGIANKASPETVERVRTAAAALDYRPSSAGKALRQKQSRLVAVLAANMANPTMAAIAASAEVALRENGLVMVLCDTHDRPDLQDEYLREMRAQQARAIVLLGAVESPLLALLRESTMPLIFVSRRDPGSRSSYFVGIDNQAAGRDVARHALALGLLKPVVIHAPLASSATRGRVEGIAAAYREAGHPIAPDRLIAPTEREHLVIGYAGAQQVVHEKIHCDAFLCTGDLIAFGAHRAVTESAQSRKPVPFYGFDDNPLNDWIAPWLTSVRIPYAAYGKSIVELIIGDEISTARHRILDHELIVRHPERPAMKNA